MSASHMTYVALGARGECLYNIETDKIIARESASVDDIAAAVEALANFMFGRSLGDES